VIVENFTCREVGVVVDDGEVFDRGIEFFG